MSVFQILIVVCTNVHVLHYHSDIRSTNDSRESACSSLAVVRFVCGSFKTKKTLLERQIRTEQDRRSSASCGLGGFRLRGGERSTHGRPICETLS